MASFHPKRYVDRAVQTDSGFSARSCIKPICFSDSELAITLSGSDGSFGKQQTLQQECADDCSWLGAPNAGNAYTQSQASEANIDVVITTSRKACKQSGIGSGRPSAQNSPAKRITSLPSISTSTGQIERQVRVVSMPERNKYGELELSLHANAAQANTSGSTDNDDHSVDSAQGQGFSGRKLKYERQYPTDLPQTPSPPSSPESVMIIGNEGHVSGSFLRRSCTDEDGWITWASSPPRPIPALHGPLSLPYARCPSGAEGTVIEGDDLSNKIWGLGVVDNAHAQSSRSAKNQVSRQQDNCRGPPLQQPANYDTSYEECSPGTSFHRGRDAVIDLSKPLTFRRSIDLGVPHGYAHQLDRPTNSPKPRVTLADLSVSGKSDCYHDNLLAVFDPQNVKSSANAVGVHETFSTPLGLGLNWNGKRPSLELVHSCGSSGHSLNPRNRLNTSAAVFVPGNNGSSKSYSSAHTHPADNSGSLVSRQRDRLSRTTVSLPRGTEQQYYMTTPNTASPRWSPAFSQVYAIDEQKKAPTRYTPQNAMHHNPRVYSPQLDLDDYSSNLRVMMEQLHVDSYDYTAPRVPITDRFIVPNSTSTVQHQSGTLFKHGNASPTQNELPHTHHIDTVAHEPMISSKETQQAAHTLDANNLLFSSDRRRNLPYQHPRSIPLARLIQRRLSSVVEEDTARDSLLPLLRKRATELPKQNIETHAQVFDEEEDGCEMDAEEIMESTVSVESPPVSPTEFNAIQVNLPKIENAAHYLRNSGKVKKPARNDTASRKENTTTPNAFAHDSTHLGKQKSRQRKSDTPLRTATNPIL